MSITKVHRRNDSEELDVFEAARYFSGYNINNEENNKQLPWRSGGRISLDLPIIRNPIPQQTHLHNHHKHQIPDQKQVKEKKYKQPSSPGGRLASFLNSLFNQTGSKKKKSSKTQSLKDEAESPGGRRKRRSSISHFRSASSAVETKSFYSTSSSSGFRTPPPIKSYKDFRSYSKYANLDEKLKINHNGLKTTATAITTPGGDRYATEEKGSSRKFSEFDDDDDDGAESDSSSDLFELQNYDLGIYSNGLPVYETTHMDSIKRGAPISNAAL